MTRRHGSRSAWVIVVAVALGVGTGPASAKKRSKKKRAAAKPAATEADAEAKGAKEAAAAQGYIDLAADLFRLGKYDEAAEGFERAAKTLEEGGLEKPPALLRALARCYDQLGRTTEALDGYERFLLAANAQGMGDGPGGKQARAARDRLRGLLDRTRLSFDVRPEGALVTLDGEILGTAPLEPEALSPGSHEVKVSADGFVTMRVTLEVSAGATIPVTLALAKSPTAEVDKAPTADAAAAAVAPAPPEAAAGTGDAPATWATWLALGGGAALVASGLLFGLRSQSAIDERDALKGSPATYAEYQTHDEAARSRALASNVLYASGAVSLVAGLVMLLTAPPEPAP